MYIEGQDTYSSVASGKRSKCFSFTYTWQVVHANDASQAPVWPCAQNIISISMDELYTEDHILLLLSLS